jgi:DNA polymerase alpha-associated DNA helicase A
LVGTTLDYKARNGEDGELVRDVGKEIEGVLGELGKKRGEKGSVRGKERGKKWDEARELRKE